MSATITKIPLTVSLSKDDNWIELETDQINKIYPYLRFYFDPSGALVGETITIEWLTYSIVMTCVAGVPNESGTQFTQHVAPTDLPTWTGILAEAFRKNELLFDNWTIEQTTNGGIGIILQYKEAIDLLPVGAITTVGASAVPSQGQNPVQQENLQGVIKVIETDPVTTDESTIVSLSAPYEVETKRVQFNLNNLPTVKPHLPNESSTQASVPGVHSYEYGHAFDAYRKVYVRYADKYGSPAISEQLKKSFEFYMLYGGSPAHSLHQFQMGSGQKLCHSHIWNGTQFYKPTGITQPDWVYIFTTSILQNVVVSAKITFEDGTQEEYTVPTSVQMNLDQYKMYWFSSGYNQMGIDQSVGVLAGKTVVFYEFRLTSSDFQTSYASIGYDVNCECQDWEQYLLFSNGLGGCESVRIAGKKESNYNVNRQAFQKSRAFSFSAKDGEIGYYDETAVQGFEVNTGWYNRSYIEHLRQLLLGKTWLIDTANNRFINILIQTTSIKPSMDDEDLFSLQLTYQYASKDYAYHEK